MDSDAEKRHLSIRSSITKLRTKENLQITLLSPLKSDLSSISTNIIHNYHFNDRSSDNHWSIRQPNSNKSRIFKSDDANVREKTQRGPYLVKLSFQLVDQYAVLSHLESDMYIFCYITQSTYRLLSNGDATFQSFQTNENISHAWSSTLYKEKKNNIKVSMSPPIESSPVRQTDSQRAYITANDDQEPTDPFDYFMHKYFDTLYQLTTPLTFFTKSTFSRLKTLCSQTSPEVGYQSILKQFLINFEDFDSRHLLSNNGILNSVPLFEMEVIYRDGFISKSLNLIDCDVHSLNFLETNKSLINTLNQLKIREIQLQLITLLEVIYVEDLDSSKSFRTLSNQKTKRKLTRKSLVGKRRIVSTPGGGAVVDEVTNTQGRNLNYTELFDSYVERFCIWDVLNSSSASSVTNNTSVSSSSLGDYSSRKFISSVIIPFFEKKCPHSVKHLITKIRGPSLKPRPTATQAVETTAERSSYVVSSASNDAGSREEVKLALSRTSSKLGDLDEFKLNRSNSDLQMLKRNSSFNATKLSKREIDFSMPVKASSSKSLKRSNSVIFNRVGKKLNSESSKAMRPSTSTTSQALHSESFSQVNETPVKKQKVINVLETPNDSKFKETRVMSSGETRNSNHLDLAPNGVIISSAVKTNSPAIQPGLQSPLMTKSSAKRRPGEPFEFRSPEDGLIRASPSAKSRVRRKLFAPKPHND